MRIGTRASALARVQSDQIATLLRELNPGLAVEVVLIQSEGDRKSRLPLQAFTERGVFVRKLQQALLENQIDLAVHSLKDMPLKEPEGLTVAAFPPRAAPHDVLVAAVPLERLAPGASVGTSSPRRAQLLGALRPDLHFEPVRGNIDTRLRKLNAGRYGALVLAAAGIERLSLSHATTVFPLSPETLCPAPGQGALALEVRSDDAATRAVAASLDDAATRACVEAEREVLRLLGGGCHLPLGAYCQNRPGHFEMLAVLAADGVLRKARHCGPDPAALAESAARALGA